MTTEPQIAERDEVMLAHLRCVAQRHGWQVIEWRLLACVDAVRCTVTDSARAMRLLERLAVVGVLADDDDRQDGTGI